MIDIANTKINFLKSRIITFIFSSILVVLSFGAFFVSGLNFGIDFKGGTSVSYTHLRAHET